MHRLLVENAARAKDEDQGDQAAEHDHPVAAEYPERFQQPDVDAHADQRTDEGAEPSDQAVGKRMHPQHDSEVPGIDEGHVVGEQHPADPGDGAGQRGRGNLVAGRRNPDARGGGLVVVDHPEREAEPRTFEHDEEDDDREQAGRDDPEISPRRDAVVDDVANVAEALRPLRADHEAAHFDLVDQVDPRQSHELRERESRNREIEPAEPEGQRPDQRGRRTGDQPTEYQGGGEIESPHRGHGAAGERADPEVRLLPERDLPRDEEQVGAERDEGFDADEREHAHHVVAHRPTPDPAPPTPSACPRRSRTAAGNISRR